MLYHQGPHEDSRRDLDQRSTSLNPQRSHGYSQRSHDGLPENTQGLVGDRQRSVDSTKGSLGNRQAVHDSTQSGHRQGSHGYNQSSHGRQHQRLAYNQSEPPQEVAESSEFPLPNSPAPPPYKSPSPDSEQAQVLQQLGHRPPRAQFVYHASSLGMGMEQFTDLSIVAETGGEERVNGQNVQRRARSPGRQRVIPGPPAHQQEMKHQGAIGKQGGSAEADTTDMAQGPGSHGGSERSKTTGHDGAIVAASTDAAQCLVRRDSGERSKTPDILREIEELMGGVEAMVSEANMGAAAMGDASVGEGGNLGTGTNLELEWVSAGARTAEVVAGAIEGTTFPDRPLPLTSDHIQTELPSSPDHMQDRPSPPNIHLPLSHTLQSDHMLTVTGGDTAYFDASFGGSVEEMESFSPVSAPAGFGGEEDGEEGMDGFRTDGGDDGMAERAKGTVTETRGPEIDIQGPEIVIIEEPSSGIARDGRPRVKLRLTPADQAEDNLADVSGMACMPSRVS